MHAMIYVDAIHGELRCNTTVTVTSSFCFADFIGFWISWPDLSPFDSLCVEDCYCGHTFCFCCCFGLPHAVRSSATYNIFKKDLKSHLLEYLILIVTIVFIDYMFSVLVTVHTAYWAIQIVRFTLHYMANVVNKTGSIF